MANIKQELLDRVSVIHKNQRFTKVEGTYDGLVGELSVTFFEGDTQVVDFVYEGTSVTEFREYLYRAAGEAVKIHNSEVYVPDRSAFIDSVTE